MRWPGLEVGMVTALQLLAGPAAAQSSRLVDVGGHRVEVVVEGTGAPAVIFEAGLGQHRIHWAGIQDSVATFTTAVAYSRPGYGMSDPATTPRTPLQVAAELRTLLDSLGVPGPYVLVGQSLGGLYLRVFAKQYAEDTAGLVLVDPTAEGIDRELAALFPTYWDDTERDLDEYAARVGGGAAGEVAAWWPIMRSGALPEAWPLPNVPMVVLTALKEDPTWVGGTAQGLRIWRRLHAEIFEQTTLGAHIVTRESGHNIHEDQPGLVLASIRNIVDLIR